MDFKTFKYMVEKAQMEYPLLFDLDHNNIPRFEEIYKFREQYQIQLPIKQRRR